jgi:NAD-dependent SIR2 family protein deacetylase
MRDTEKSSFKEQIERAREAVEQADLVLIGASNGFDMTEGLNIFRPDGHFRETYGDFAQAWGISSVLEGLARPWEDERARWGFLARFAAAEWLGYTPSRAMASLKKIVGARPYFILTCNIDGRFVRAGANAQSVLETEGTIRELVCSAGCSPERVDAAPTFERLAASGDMMPARELLPTCGHCGAPLVPALDEARALHPDPSFKERTDRLAQLLREARGKNVLVLELGVGPRNGAIRMPLIEAACHAEHASYLVLSLSTLDIPKVLGDKGCGLQGDLADTLSQLAETNK